MRAVEVVRTGKTLFKPCRSLILEDHSETYRAIAARGAERVVNTEGRVRDEVIQILDRRNLVKNTDDLIRPYWNPDTAYKLSDVVGSTIQFVDEHREPLPVTCLPPYDDIMRYQKTVMSQAEPVPIWEQLEILLDIADDNLVGASNLGFVSSRLFARGGDLRAYPTELKAEDFNEWNEKIAQFETNKVDEVNDGPGDTYYFWTHFFVAACTTVMNTCSAKLTRHVYKAGTPVMRMVRNNIGSWTVSDHKEASLLGRRIGYEAIRRMDGAKIL